MAFIEMDFASGGGSEPSIDLLHPDYFIGKQCSSSGTVINCGFKPRFVILAPRTSSATASAVGLVIIDVEKNAVTNSWATNMEKIDVTPQDIITDVTDTGFTVMSTTFLNCFAYK